MFSFSDLACFALYSSAYLAIAIASLLYMRKVRGIEDRCEALEMAYSFLRPSMVVDAEPVESVPHGMADDA